MRGTINVAPQDQGHDIDLSIPRAVAEEIEVNATEVRVTFVPVGCALQISLSAKGPFHTVNRPGIISWCNSKIPSLFVKNTAQAGTVELQWSPDGVAFDFPPKGDTSSIVAKQIQIGVTAGAGHYGVGACIGGAQQILGFYRTTYDTARGINVVNIPSKLDHLVLTDKDSVGPACTILFSNSEVQTGGVGGVDIFRDTVVADLATAWNDSAFIIHAVKVLATDWISSSGSKFLSLAYLGGLELQAPGVSANAEVSGALYMMLVADAVATFASANALSAHITGRWGDV